MGFNADRFMGAQFSHRTEKVRVDALKGWFDKGSDPVWVVRGLTSSELAKANEALAKQKNMALITEAMMSAQGKKEKLKAVRESLGLIEDQTPSEIAKRMEMLVSGSVEPVIDLAVAVKLAESFPIEFHQLTNKITQLTGLGMTVAETGKSKPSGKKPTSKTSSASAT